MSYHFSANKPPILLRHSCGCKKCILCSVSTTLNIKAYFFWSALARLKWSKGYLRSLSFSLHLSIGEIDSIFFEVLLKCICVLKDQNVLHNLCGRYSRYRPRFFDQVGHQTKYAIIGKRHFVTLSHNRQPYQNYEQSWQKFGIFVENKVL